MVFVTHSVLRLPALLPYFLGGLRISSRLAMSGAVVAEFVAGSGGRASGLAYRILESGYQHDRSVLALYEVHRAVQEAWFS